MYIGVDLDDTLFDLNTPIFKRINEEFGTSYKNNAIQDWDLSTFPSEIRKRIFECYKDASIMGQLIPFIWSGDKIREWKKQDHDVYTITSRCRELVYPTIAMVNRHFGHDIDSVPVTEGPKTEYFKHFELDVWIDDSPHGVQESLDLGIRTIMISNDETKYNHHMRQVDGLEVVEHIGCVEL